MLETVGAIQSVKVLYDLLKSAVELRDGQKYIAAVSEVNQDILELQHTTIETQKELLLSQKRVAALEEELASIKDWKHEAQRYQLTTLREDILVMSPKPGMEQGEPPHKLCTTCFSNGKKGYLNLDSTGFDGGQLFRCLMCGNRIRVPGHGQPPSLGNPDYE